MYILHYAPDNASMIIRLVLEGAGLPYRTMLLDRRIRQQDSAAYRALNPTGLIPTLETPEGPIPETGAILLWLGEKHGLVPTSGQKDRSTLLRWLFYISNTPHADLRQLFYPEQYVPAEAQSEHHAILSGRMRRHYGILDAAAKAHPAVFSTSGILAPYLCAMMRWSVLYPLEQDQWFRISDFPTLHDMAKAMEVTPQALAVAEAEGLGPTPFSAPVLPNPPEGVAL